MKKTLFMFFSLAILATVVHAGTLNDGFEHGDFTTNPTWTVVSGSPFVQSGTVKNGVYAVNVTNGFLSIAPQGFPQDKNYQAWMDGNVTPQIFFGFHDDGGATFLSIRTDINTSNNIVVFDGTSYHDFDPPIHFTENKWYLDIITYDRNTTMATASIYDSDGTTLLGRKNLTVSSSTIHAIVIGENSGVSGGAIFDDVTYGAVHPAGLNVTVPNAVNTYIQGGTTYEIDLNVGNATQNAPGLLFDINYSDTNRLGTGTVIVSDGNVASTIGLSCDSNTGTTSAAGTTCRYKSWTVPSLDANKFIVAAVSVSTINNNQTADASDNNFFIDTTVPSTTSDINNSVWQKAPISVKLTCIDTNENCLLTQYRLDIDRTSGTSMGAWTTYTTTIPINSDGNYEIDYNSSDPSGHLETTHTQFALVDMNAPSTTSDVNNSVWQNHDVNLHFTCTDDVNGSGCNVTQYRLDTNRQTNISMGPWTTYSPATGVPINYDGNMEVDWNSSDNAGNLETTNTAFLLVDKNAPTITTYTPTSNNSTSNNTVDFNFSGQDDVNGIGLKTCEIIVYNNADGSVVVDTNVAISGASGVTASCGKTVGIAVGQTFKGQANFYDLLYNRSADQNTALWTGINPSGAGNGGGGGGGGGGGSTTTTTPQTDFELQGATNGTLEIDLPKKTASTFSLIITNTGTQPIDHLSIDFGDANQYISWTDYNSFINTGQKKQFTYNFDAKHIDANTLDTTLTISTPGKTKQYPTTITLQENFLTSTITLLSTNFGGLGLTLNAWIAAIAYTLLVALTTARLDKAIGKTPTAIILYTLAGIALASTLTLITFTGVIA